MQTTVTVIKDIAVPPEWAWEKISSVGGVQHWMPGVADCRMEGRGIGAHRLCKTEMGWIREVVENIEHVERKFEYSVEGQGMLPFTKFRGIMQVFLKARHYSCIKWEGRFTARGQKSSITVEMLEGLFAQGITGLEELYLSKRNSFVLP